MADEKPKAVDSGSREKYNHPVLTDAEVEAAKASAKKKALAARAKAAAAKIEADETERLMQEEGVNTHEEMVTITLDLPPDMLWLATNGKRYLHARAYTLPRSIALDLLHRQYAGWQNESARLGESRFAFYQKQRAPAINHVNGKIV